MYLSNENVAHWVARQFRKRLRVASPADEGADAGAQWGICAVLQPLDSCVGVGANFGTTTLGRDVVAVGSTGREASFEMVFRRAGHGEREGAM